MADLQRLAAEGKAIQGEGVEMDLATCKGFKVIDYIEDCSHLK